MQMQRSTARRFLTLAALSLAGILAGSLAFTQPATPLNNASSALAADHTSGSGTLVLTAGTGARFGSTFPVIVTVAARSTLVNGQIAPTSVQTIFRVTGRSGDTLTGLTATENTSDRNYHTGDPVQALVTAGMLQSLQDQINAIGGGGSGNALTLQPAGATTAGTLAARAAVTYDAKADFGAVGDGTANDTASLLAGIAAVKANGGGTLILPRGTYVITRHLALPSNFTLAGLGAGVSTLTRPATVVATLTADAAAGATTVTVGSTANFVVGREVAVWDDNSAANWPTFGLVLSKTATTLTIDTPLDFDFTMARHATVGTVFQLITNEAASTKIVVKGLTLDGNRVGLAPDNVFPFASLEWRNTTDSLVADCEFVRAIADGYSDQANDYRIAAPDPVAAIRSSRNRIERCRLAGCPNYAIHLGTFMDGAYVLDNTVLGPSREGVHYSAYIRRTLSRGNYFADCTTAFGSLDVRDVGNVIANNVIERCTGESIPTGAAANTLVIGNRIDAPATHAIHVQGDDCVLTGNLISMGSNTGIGIWVDAGNREVIQGNTVDGGAAGSIGIAIGNSTGSRVTGNNCHANNTGVVIAVCTRLTLSNTTIEAPISGTAIDATGGGTDCALWLNPTSGSLTGSSSQTRLLTNGLGDNGNNDPASAGSWNSISGRQWDGTLVRWSNGAEQLSRYYNGAWANLAAGVLTSPTFTAASTTTPAITLQGVSGQAQILDVLAFGGSRKFRFNLKNAFSTYAGLTLENDAVPNLRFVGNSTTAGEGGSIFFCDTAGNEIWQNYRPADSGGYGNLNRRVGGTVGNFGYAFYADTSNRMAFGTVVSGTGYIPPTLTDQITVNVGDPARKGLVLKGAASQAGNLIEGQTSTGTALFSHLADGSLRLPHLADTAAANDSIYYSTTAGKMVFKDPGGVVNPLY